MTNQNIDDSNSDCNPPGLFDIPLGDTLAPDLLQTPAEQMRDAACQWAKQGFAVFRLSSGSKKPLAGSNGFGEASRDPDIIRSWDWEIAGQPCNLACYPEACEPPRCVVDIDHADAMAAWLGKNPPSTMIVKTPKGEHWWYEGSLPGTQSRLAPGIDTRGQGGYALLPPSIVNGKPYTLSDDRAPAPLPQWVSNDLQAHEPIKATVTDIDLAGARARTKRRIADQLKVDNPTRGAGANTRTFQFLAQLRDLGLSQDECLALFNEGLADIGQPCEGEWQDQLQTITGNVWRHAQNEEGAWATEAPEKTFGHFDGLVSSKQIVDKRSRFTPRREAEMDNAPPIKWLIPLLIQDATTVLVVGETQSFKSFVTLDIALAVATGCDTAFGVKATRTGPVVYAMLEGRDGIEKMRRPAWKKAHGVAAVPNFVTTPAPLILLDDEKLAFMNEIEAMPERPALIVFETANKMMAGLSESAPNDVAKANHFFDALVERFKCAVMLVHHRSDKAGAADIMGSMHWRAGFNTYLSVAANREQRIADVKVMKHKDGSEREEPWALKGELVAFAPELGPAGESLAFQPFEKAQRPAPPTVDARTAEQRKFKELVMAARERCARGGGELTVRAVAEELHPQNRTLNGEAWEQRVTSCERRMRRGIKTTTKGLGYLSDLVETDAAGPLEPYMFTRPDTRH